MILLDAIQVTTRDQNWVQNKAAHITVEVDLDVVTHVLGISSLISQSSRQDVRLNPPDNRQF